MEMKEELEKLKNLQDILAEKYEIEAKIEELPKKISGSTDSLEKFRKEYIDLSEKYNTVKEKVEALKVDLAQAQKEREEGEKGMDSIETHREYEILDKQINEAQQKEEEIRKELLKEEKYMADLNDRLKNQEELVQSTESYVNEEKSGLAQEVAVYNEKLAALTESEKEFSEGIDTETIIKFQRIIKRNRKGIVSVNGNVCDGCHMILPAQFANEVHDGHKILFCPYCSRILYYEKNDATTENYFSLEDAGSLADLDDDEFIDDDDVDARNEIDGDSDESKSMDYDE